MRSSERQTFQLKQDMGLSRNARFHRVIKRDLNITGLFEDVVIEIHPHGEVDALLDRATELTWRDRKPVVVENLGLGVRYLSLNQNGKLVGYRHGIEDGLAH